jgi:hypothetical protein
MPTSIATLGGYLRFVESRSGGRTPVIVTEGTLEDARYWHQIVQPFITQATPTRLDRHWNWPRLLSWTRVLERLAGRNAVFLQLNAETTTGDAFPIGQVLLSDGYPFFPDQRQASVFLWYLASAPPEALRAYGLHQDLKLMRPLVDIGVQFSLQRGYAGRLTLHAAASGNRAADGELYDKYESGVGLVPYGPARWRVTLFRRNDGRYFYADEARALYLSKRLDHLR